MSSAATEGRSRVRYLDVADRIWPLTRRFMGVHTLVYRATRRPRRPHRARAFRRCSCSTTSGAKSGTKRTSPLLYFKDGDDLVIVASKGGFPKHPAWYHNLMANPDTEVQVGSEHRARPRPRRDRRGARAALAGRAQAVPRLRRLPGAQQGPRNTAGHPRAPR